MEISFTIPNLSSVVEFLKHVPSDWYIFYGLGVAFTLAVVMVMCYDQDRPNSTTPLYGWQIILLMISWPIWFVLLVVWGVWLFLFTNHLKDQ